MKWYSVREYQPILTICCVLVAVHDGKSGNIHLELAEYANGWKDWLHKEDIEYDSYKVLYFCYPDPIPKAYEQLIENQNKKTDPKFTPCVGGWI